ncbi:hypothetical protein [Pandoraea oxalativorans]|uniref:Calcineurin-like phosphoesterase domain-containing protein n=1 Tax=Pandoraea oxalativorans TaxID=573737 RepID=A0A0G3IGS9_9BURK|nr:hypothetical protein [Pandoraea oxalativorans]AKK25066.1 hypothetical protein MB84_30500 [Pandoraea oxalativorans]
MPTLGELISPRLTKSPAGPASTEPNDLVIDPQYTNALDTLSEALVALEDDINRSVKNDFDCGGLRRCNETIAELKAQCTQPAVKRDALVTSLASVAASVEDVRQEVQTRKDTLAPGVAERLLGKLGILLGILVGVAVFTAAPYLAPGAAILGVAKAGAASTLVASVIGQGWAMARANKYQNVAEIESQLETMRTAMIRAEAECTMVGIKAALKDDQQALTCFDSLLDIPDVDKPPGSVAPPKIIVSGDTDGSTLRAILLGIQAGVIHLKTDAGRALLCRLLKAEAAAAAQINAEGTPLKDFQTNEDYQKDLADLENHLDFRRGVTELIFVGDVCHDRYSLNKDVDFSIREKMHDCGVIYIFGNHDDPRVLQPYRRPDRPNALDDMFGEYAKNGMTIDAMEAHAKEIFWRRAYWSESTQTLITHQGLEPGPGGTLKHPDGYFRADKYKGKGKKLADDINARKGINLVKKNNDYTFEERMMVLDRFFQHPDSSLYKARGIIPFPERMPSYNCPVPGIPWYQNLNKTKKGHEEWPAFLEWAKTTDEIDWRVCARLAEDWQAQIHIQTACRPSHDHMTYLGGLIQGRAVRGHEGKTVLGDVAVDLNARAGADGRQVKASAAAFYGPRPLARLPPPVHGYA